MKKGASVQEGISQITEAVKDLRQDLSPSKQLDRKPSPFSPAQETPKDRGLQVICYRCGEPGHGTLDCPRQGAQTRQAKMQHYACANQLEPTQARSEYEVPSTCDAPLYTFKGRRASYLVVGQGAGQSDMGHSHDAKAHSRKESKGVWGAAAEVRTHMNLKDSYYGLGSRGLTGHSLLEGT